MPFGVMSGLGPANSVLHGGDNTQRDNFGRKHVPNKPNTANNCDFGYKGPISLKFTYLP